MEELLPFLKSIYPLSDIMIDYLSQNLKTRKLPKREFLLKAGHISHNLCFVKKGLLRCFYIKGNVEICSWFMKEGDMVISVESFFNQTQSYESIQALEDCELICIDYNQLEYIYHIYPEFNFIARELIQKYYTQSEQRLYSLRMQRVQERYDYLKKHHANLILRVPAKYIASYLGMTEVSLSRLKAKG